eukprot:11877856-Karenia_brevis.AAC.1
MADSLSDTNVRTQLVNTPKHDLEYVRKRSSRSIQNTGTFGDSIDQKLVENIFRVDYPLDTPCDTLFSRSQHERR